MKRILIIATHFGSNSHLLCQTLDKTLIRWVKDVITYSGVDTIESITSSPHEYREIGIYLNEVF